VLETWVPWSRGATVVAPPPGQQLRGPALGAFLRATATTVLVVEPAALDGVDPDLPDLRLLVLVGPEAPAATVARWQAPGRRTLGLHGAPEAGVVAFWTDLTAGTPVRRPLAGLDVVLLDPDDPRRALPPGRVGEIGLTGRGVAGGYVGRPELTEEAFVPIPGQPGRRTFRTGDLGRLTPDRGIEWAGRAEGAGGRGLRVRPVSAPAPALTRRSGAPGRTSVMPLHPGKPRGPVRPEGLDAPTVAQPAETVHLDLGRTTAVPTVAMPPTPPRPPQGPPTRGGPGT
jgi:non-ribosomal peptide synthetase component F